MKEAFLLPRHCLLQERPPVSEGKTTTKVKMRKICFSRPPALAVGQRGTLLRGVCVGSLKEACAGRWCLEPRGDGWQRGETPSHSLWNQEGEDERGETLPEPGLSEEKEMIHLSGEEVVEEGGCLGLVKGMAVGMKMDSRLWPLLVLTAEVSVCPIVRLRMGPLRRLPGQHQQRRFEWETGSAGKAARGPRGQVWHLSERVEN